MIFYKWCYTCCLLSCLKTFCYKTLSNAFVFENVEQHVFKYLERMILTIGLKLKYTSSLNRDDSLLTLHATKNTKCVLLESSLSDWEPMNKTTPKFVNKTINVSNSNSCPIVKYVNSKASPNIYSLKISKRLNAHKNEWFSSIFAFTITCLFFVAENTFFTCILIFERSDDYSSNTGECKSEN